MVLADKGYTSKAKREHLTGHGLKDGIMRKATRGKPLSDKDKEFNRQIVSIEIKLSVPLEVSDAGFTEGGVDIGD